MNDSNLIWQWKRCERLAYELDIKLDINGSDLISIVQNEKFLYNAKTIEAVHAFLTAMEQSK